MPVNTQSMFGGVILLIMLDADSVRQSPQDEVKQVTSISFVKYSVRSRETDIPGEQVRYALRAGGGGGVISIPIKYHHIPCNPVSP